MSHARVGVEDSGSEVTILCECRASFTARSEDAARALHVFHFSLMAAREALAKGGD